MFNSSVEDTQNSNTNIKINGILMNFDIPKVMGILNVTNDSFYQGSRLRSDNDLLTQAEKQLSEGATFLDLGGLSTRLNADLIDEKEERSRIQNALRILKKEFPTTLFSVDTFRASVAESAIEEGASIINDISGYKFDNQLIKVLEKYPSIAYVLMHIDGDFHTMHQLQLRNEEDLKRPILDRVNYYFSRKLEELNSHGISNVILDPGFGFSKTLEENYTLLKGLDSFKSFSLPILAGVSRKSMIYKKLESTPEEALNGTTVLNTVAFMKGAAIFRVHDVKPCMEVIQLLK